MPGLRWYGATGENRNFEYKQGGNDVNTWFKYENYWK